MNEPNPLPPRQKYKWPWFVAAAVLLGFVLTILAVWREARHVEQERDVDGPMPSQR